MDIEGKGFESVIEELSLNGNNIQICNDDGSPVGPPLNLGSFLRLCVDLVRNSLDEDAIEWSDNIPSPSARRIY